MYDVFFLLGFGFCKSFASLNDLNDTFSHVAPVKIVSKFLQHLLLDTGINSLVRLQLAEARHICYFGVESIGFRRVFWLRFFSR